MAEVNVYYDPMGNTLTVWFGDHDLNFRTAIALNNPQLIKQLPC